MSILIIFTTEVATKRILIVWFSSSSQHRTSSLFEKAENLEEVFGFGEQAKL